MDFDYFEDKAVAIHGYKYGYSQVTLVNNKTKVEILCPEHGVFRQTPDRHLRGAGCPKCSRKNRVLRKPMTADEFFSEASDAHEGFYDYSSSVYSGMEEKVSILCPIHGPFETSARKHLQEKRGCPACGRVKTKYANSVMFQDFFDAAVDRHGFNYDYSEVSLRFFSDDIYVTCPKHGEFQVTASGHLRGKGCPGCRPSGSCPENELSDFLEGLGLNVVRNSRKIIPPFELDIVIPDLQIAFEFNGIFWHSEQAGKSSTYHSDKTERALAAGYRVFHVYESEWDLYRDALRERIQALIHQPPLPDLSSAYFLHEYSGRYSLVLKGEVVAYFNVCDGVALDYWSKYGLAPIKVLMGYSGVTLLKVERDWPEFTNLDLSREGFQVYRRVRPERMYFDKKTLRRLKEKPASASSSYLSVVNSGSTIWVVEDGIHDDGRQGFSDRVV